MILEQGTGGRSGLGLVIYRLDKARRPSACTQGRVYSPTFLCRLPRVGRVYFLEVWPYAANSSLNSIIIVFFYYYYYCIGIVPCLLALDWQLRLVRSTYRSSPLSSNRYIVGDTLSRSSIYAARRTWVVGRHEHSSYYPIGDTASGTSIASLNRTAVEEPYHPPRSHLPALSLRQSKPLGSWRLQTLGNQLTGTTFVVV